MLETGWDFPADLNEAAWGLIANAWDAVEARGGTEAEAWVPAVDRWRDAYHETLPPPSTPRPEEEP